VLHELGPGLGICRVDIPADAVVPHELVGRRELERAGRMRDAAERGFLLGSHAVLRSVLAEATGQSATELELFRDEYGKPRLADGPLRFNMSRSKSVALIGLSRAREIGVDIEIIDEVPDLETLAREHFSPREHEAWRRLDPASTVPAFLQCWVRKEACIKAAGIGVGLRLDQLDVGWVANGIPARVALEYRQRRWDTLVASLPMPPGLVAAAAVVT
jgi:4'-phosphopantetheinyl transferase